MSLQVLMMPMTGLPAQSARIIAELPQPRAVAERAQVVDPEPAVAAQVFGAFAGHGVILFKAGAMLKSTAPPPPRARAPSP